MTCPPPTTTTTTTTTKTCSIGNNSIVCSSHGRNVILLLITSHSNCTTRSSWPISLYSSATAAVSDGGGVKGTFHHRIGQCCPSNQLIFKSILKETSLLSNSDYCRSFDENYMMITIAGNRRSSNITKINFDFRTKSIWHMWN